MTITKQGVSGDGRPIVYWSDGSWSYADNFDTRGIPQDGIGTSDNPVYHFTGDPSQPTPGSDGTAYTLVGGSKQFVEPSLFGGQVHRSDNSFWNQGDQWDAASGKYVSKGMDPGNILALGIGGVLGGEAAGALGAFGGGSAAAGESSAPVLEGIAAGPGATSIPAASAAYGPLAGGYGAATTSAAVPASLGAVSGGAAVASNPIAGFFTGLAKSGVLPSIISAAAGLGGAAIGANATKDAAQIQADTAAKAIAAQQQLYQQQRADLTPYRQQGSGAISKLGQLWGVTPGKDINLPGNPYSTQPVGVTPTKAPLTNDPATGLPLYAPGSTVGPNAPNTSTGQIPSSLQNLAGPSGAPNQPGTTAPAQVGEQRVINGQPARWDGTGWLAVNGGQ